MRYLIHQLLEQSAAKSPDSPALVDGERQLTYAELDASANRLAQHLIELGVGRGDRVALYLDKSADSIIGIYGVLKAGAAYVPLDPQAPTSRLAYITSNAGVRVLLTGVEKAEAVSGLRAEAPTDHGHRGPQRSGRAGASWRRGLERLRGCRRSRATSPTSSTRRAPPACPRV